MEMNEKRALLKSWQHLGDAIVMLLEQEKESAYKIIREYKWDLDKNS